MSLMTLQIVKFLDFKKTQNIIFSSNKKIQESHIMVYFMANNIFVAEVTFKRQPYRMIKHSQTIRRRIILVRLTIL